MSSYRIPFNKPCLNGKELLYVAEAIIKGHASGDGTFTKKCHAFLEGEFDVRRALLTTSCTHALEMAALLLDIQPGDEVIVPSFTFVSSVNAFVLRGATPVFADIRPDTLNMDDAQLEHLITPRTKAIVVVHYAGVSCEMEAILQIAGKHGVEVVEDNAHGLFAKYKGQYLGTFGCMATQSFHETKNITCGEGGALLINRASFVDRAEILREKGTNRSRFYRGQVDKYTWVDLGSSYLPSDMLAAYLCAQLEGWKSIQEKRKNIWDRYSGGLKDWASGCGVQLPMVPHDCEQSHHMFYMLVQSINVRQALIEHLQRKGILSVFHYSPLNVSEMGMKFGGYAGQCPVSESVCDRLLRLPFYNDLSEHEQDEVIEGVCSFSLAAAAA